MYLLILGAKSDIAKEVAKIYAKNGYNLYLAGRGKKQLDRQAKDLEIRYSVKAKALEFDALAFSKHSSFYSRLPEKPFGVICVFGYMGDERLASENFLEARKIIDSNFTGAVSILNLIAADMRKRNQGFIIGISSVAGDRGRKSNFYYGSSKAAFTTFLSGLRNSLSNTKVQVLSVKPGFVATAMTEAMELPPLLTAQPEQVARDIYRAQIKGKDIIYTGWYWKWIMVIIKLIPEKIFKKLNL